MESSFLKYFITEGIYVIDDATEIEKPVVTVAVEEPTVVEEPKSEYKEPEAPKAAVADICVVLIKSEDKENEMLQKLLTAIKVSKPDYAFDLDLKSGHKDYLIFGEFSTKEKYVIHETDVGRMLISDEVDLLNSEDALKRKLWTQLQTMFLRN